MKRPNGNIESFHDKLRGECLNRGIFGTLREARAILESWCVEYNELRPHSSLGYLSPSEYKQRNQSDGGSHAARRGRRSGEPGANAPWRQINQTTKQTVELQF